MFTKLLPEFLAAWSAQPLFATLDLALPHVRPRRTRCLVQNRAGFACSLGVVGTGAMLPLWHGLGSAAPFTAVAGASDTKLAAIAARMARYPGVQGRCTAEAGHAPHLERPDLFVPILKNATPSARSPSSR